MSIAPGRRAFLAWLLAAGGLLCACTRPPPPPLEPIDPEQLPTEAPAQARATAATAVATPVVAGTVIVSDFVFVPATLLITRGGRVTWTNNGRAVHRIVADNGSFDLGQMPPGASIARGFTSIGSFAYHCAIHPAMHGTILVR